MTPQKMNIGKIFEFFWKIGEKDTPFFQKFSKEIHRIPNFESGAYRGPHQNHLFFQSGAYTGRCLYYKLYKAPFLYISDFGKKSKGAPISTTSENFSQKSVLMRALYESIF